MAVKALIFGTDDLFTYLKTFYDRQIKSGNLEIVGYADPAQEDLTIYSTPDFSNRGGGNFDVVIISSHHNFYDRMKLLESKGIARKNIVDGRVLKVANLDFQKFMNERVAYGAVGNNGFSANIYSVYPMVYRTETSVINFGTKSYIVTGRIFGRGIINLGNYTSCAGDVTFNVGMNNSHNYHNIDTYARMKLDWAPPKEFYPVRKKFIVNIGSDVWVGLGSIFKNANTDKPLVIGDGAVIASDSNVVSNVPPYAIVGGNPAKVIKYRFPEKIIEALLRIKWWNWDIDRIHDNFKYFNDIEKFVEMNDPKLHPENFSVDLNKPFQIVPH